MVPPRFLYNRLLSLVLFATPLSGALILNGGANPALSQRVTLQPIIVSDDGGGNTSTFLGTAVQQALIEDLVDQIWAQAGIDVAWLAPRSWSSTFANLGLSDPRPNGDLLTVRAQGDAVNVGNADPLVIDLYFVRIPAGFGLGDLSVNSTAGLGVVGGNGIMVYIGSALASSEGGRDAIASLIAHEIGHNLGLPHLNTAFNLLQEGDAPNQGQQLNAAQIAAALASDLSTPLGVPEPGTFLVLSLALPLAIRARRFTSL